MIDLGLVLDDVALRRRFGSATLDRAWAYVRQGHVLAADAQLDSEGDLEISGQVSGSTPAPYQVELSVVSLGAQVQVYSSCSCFIGGDCKHVLAVLITVRDEQDRGDAGGPGLRRWERQLASVLDELDDAAADRLGSAAAPHRPLALQVDLNRAPARHRSWTTQSGHSGSRGSLRLRPLQRGARNNWVRSGVSWADVPQLERRSEVDPEQAAVLNDLLNAYRTASRQTFFGAETHFPLAAFGSSLWQLLERAEKAGLVLVAGAALSSLRVAAEPVAIELDVNAGSREDAHVRLGVRADDEWYSAGDIDVLGSAGHGVALWLPGDRPETWAVTLAPLSRPAGPAVRRMLAEPGDVVVPAGDREDLVLDYLPRLRRHVPVVSSDGSVRVPEPAVPRLVLTVRWVAVDEVAIDWTWRYRTGAGAGADDRVYRIDETRGLRGFRRPEAEQALLEGLRLTDDQVYVLCDSQRRERELLAERTFTDAAAIQFAEDVLPGLEGQVEVDEIGGRPDYQEAQSAPVIHFAARTDEDEEPGRTDWLDLEVVISVDGQFIALAHLLEALTLGHEKVILRSGLHISVDRPEFAHLAELVNAARELQEQPSDGVRVSHHDLGLWDELAEVGIVDAQASQWVEAAQALRGLERLPEVHPIGLDAELRSYQLEGFRWLAFLWQCRLGGILADDMGLGKTMQTLALVAHARARGAGPFLVVAPTSVVSMWAHEAARFTPGLVVRTVTESQSRRGSTIRELHEGADLVITSYTLFRLEADAYVDEAWGGLVLDEAQTVKNHTGKTYQCVRRLDVPFRVALTGTPMENRLMELWSLLSIVAPGLYPYPQRFVELVANPVERLGDSEVLARFRRRIRPFLLRRTKELVASDLPPKQEQILEVQLTPRHRKIYETHLQRERQAILGLVEEDFAKHRIAIFRSLTRLRQLSLDAALIDEKYAAVGSAKTDVLIDHLLELVAEGHRALVFSQFTSFLARVRTRLAEAGLEVAYLDGSTRNRGAVVESFRTGSAPVFLISLKAGGVGLTLTEADYVFVLDPWWNPAVEAQAVDRTHRIGQLRSVNVYRLVATDTIEEKVMELKARKAALFTKVIDGDGALSGAIGADDVRALFED